MPNIKTHLTKTAIALVLGLATVTFFVETYTGFDITFKILVYSGLCCIVGSSAPDIDHQDSIPSAIVWCVMLLLMCSGFLIIYVNNIDLLMSGISTKIELALMYAGILVLIPVTNVIFGIFQDMAPHRKILHHLLKTAGLTATLGIFVLPVSYLDGGINLLFERGLYLALFQYGVVLHILLDKSKILDILLL